MSNDEIMVAVLEALEQHRAKARSDKHIDARMSSIATALRNSGHDIPQQQIVGALDYLKGGGYVQMTNKVKSVPLGYAAGARSVAKSKGMKLPSTQKFEVTTYRIKQKGIDYLKGKTSFSKETYAPSVSVNAENSVVIIGNQNKVEANIELIRQLGELEQVISESSQLDIKTRQDIVADIETIKQQMAKSAPSRKVISILWSGVEKAAAASGAIQLAGMIAKGLGINS